MISLNTYISDLILQRTLYDATFGLNSAIERMTTGYKVNHAKDNAAGFSIIEDLNTRISSMLQVQNNTEDGISLLNTAEGGLTQIRDLLERVRDLTIQASNGIYDEKSRNAMQAEADVLIEQINQIKNSIQYDGMSIYETPAENAVAPIAQGTSFTHMTSFTLQENESLEMTFDQLSGAESSSASGTFSLNQPINSLDQNLVNTPMSYSVAPMSLDDGIATASADEIITGAFDFAANSTTTIEIDGVSYTVKNTNSSTKSLSYSKNKTTGELTLMCSNLTITGQDGVQHNLIIDGSSNTIYGGNLDDKIVINKYASSVNKIYGQDGDDILTSAGYNCQFYGNTGNDVITTTGGAEIISGGDGNDIISATNLKNGSISGNAGNDNITVIKGNSSSHVNAGDGDDIINVSSDSNGITVNGGAGTNTLNDDGTNTTAVNVVGANAFLESFGNYETKTLTINNKIYTIRNNSSAKDVIYSVDEDTGEITFKTGSITITAQDGVEHKVNLNAIYINYYGGNLEDTVYINQAGCRVYSGDGDDKIFIASSLNHIFTGNGNDYIEKIQGSGDLINSGDGDDNIIINGSHNSIIAGNGNDTIKLKTSVSNIIDGGSGNNTLDTTISDLSKILISGFDDEFNNAQSIDIGASETKIVTINGCNYTVKNDTDMANKLFYSYNPVTGQLSLGGNFLTVTADRNVSQNVRVQGNNLYFYGSDEVDTVDVYTLRSNIYTYDGDDIINNYSASDYQYLRAGDGNDIITNYASSSKTYFYGEGGDDTLINKATLTSSGLMNGGLGNDTYQLDAIAYKVNDDGGNNVYYINTNSATITSNTGADTFYVNGNSNNIDGAGGNDYFVVQGENNTVKGGTGNDYFVIEGENNNIDGSGGDDLYIDNSSGATNISNATEDPNGNAISFTLGESKNITINGKSYTIVNNGINNNSILCYYNANTDIITFEGDDFKITSANNQVNDIIINGSNNIYNGSNLVDKITIENGTENIIKTNAGNDNIKLNTENNSVDSGSGNDYIEANETCIEIKSGSGNDNLIINSSNNNINTGDDNDTVTLNGASNIVELNGGKNNITLKGEDNTITADDGDNTFSIQNDSNTITLGDGNNTLNVGSDENTINLGYGNNNINIYSNNNEIIAQSGNNKVLLDGNENKYSIQGGNQDVEITGSQNEVEIVNGSVSLNLIGNGNAIITGTQDDSFEVKGDSNTIQTLGGNNEFDIKGDSNQIQGGNGIDDIKINGNANTALGGDSSDTFMISSGENNTIDGEAGDRNTIINNGKSTTFTNVVDITPRPFEYKLKVGIGDNESTYIAGEISFNLFDFSVDFSTIENALDCLEEIDSLIASVDEQLLNIGTTVNRLELVQKEQEIKLQNMISSRSTLRDADIAEVSSDYIRKQILQSASATLLASSRNLRAESVLGLLQGLRR